LAIYFTSLGEWRDLLGFGIVLALVVAVRVYIRWDSENKLLEANRRSR